MIYYKGLGYMQNYPESRFFKALTKIKNYS